MTNADPILPAPKECSHCWHVVWTPSFHQAGQYDSQGQRCCWCGKEKPLTAEYVAPIPHGPHLAQDPFRRLAP